MAAAIFVAVCIAGIIFMLWFLVEIRKDRRTASVRHVISVAPQYQDPVLRWRFEPIPLSAMVKPDEKARVSWRPGLSQKTRARSHSSSTRF